MIDTHELRQRCERERQGLLSSSDRLRDMIASENYGDAIQLAGSLEIWLSNLCQDANKLSDMEESP